MHKSYIFGLGRTVLWRLCQLYSLTHDDAVRTVQVYHLVVRERYVRKTHHLHKEMSVSDFFTSV